VKRVYEILPQSFSEIVAYNFPKIKNEIQFFSGFDLFLVIVEVPSSEEVEYKEPSISIYKAMSHGSAGPKVVVLTSDEARTQVKIRDDMNKNEWVLEFDNEKYDISSLNTSGFDQKYLSANPVLTLVLENVRDRISKYLGVQSS
jgi:hypothetical protein